MRAEEVAQSIGWEFVETCAGGEHGAHLVRRGSEKAILKIATSAQSFASIRGGAELSDRARANGQLVPRYLDIAEWRDTGYTLQEFVDGEVPPRMTLPLAQRMIELLDTHEGQASDWPVDGVAGFGEWWTFSDTIENAPAHIRDLANEAADARDRLRGTAVPTTDVVHADYHNKNLLLRDGEIVAIIDWDGAAPGCRWYDAFLLMWWSQASTNVIDADVAPWLRPFVESKLNADQLGWYATEIACGQLEFFQRVHPLDPTEWVYESVQNYMAPYWR